MDSDRAINNTTKLRMNKLIMYLHYVHRIRYIVIICTNVSYVSLFYGRKNDLCKMVPILGRCRRSLDFFYRSKKPRQSSAALDHALFHNDTIYPFILVNKVSLNLLMLSFTFWNLNEIHVTLVNHK